MCIDKIVEGNFSRCDGSQRSGRQRQIEWPRRGHWQRRVRIAATAIRRSGNPHCLLQEKVCHPVRLQQQSDSFRARRKTAIIGVRHKREEGEYLLRHIHSSGVAKCMYVQLPTAEYTYNGSSGDGRGGNGRGRRYLLLLYFVNLAWTDRRPPQPVHKNRSPKPTSPPIISLVRLFE